VAERDADARHVVDQAEHFGLAQKVWLNFSPCSGAASDFPGEAEIASLERRIATDGATLAAVTRALSRIDLGDRARAAASLGELFRTGAGARDFTIYLRADGSYKPIVAVENDVPRPLANVEPLQDETIREAADGGANGGNPATIQGASAILVLPYKCDNGKKPFAVISYKVPPDASNNERFRRRITDLSRAFTTIVSASPERRA